MDRRDPHVTSWHRKRCHLISQVGSVSRWRLPSLRDPIIAFDTSLHTSVTFTVKWDFVGFQEVQPGRGCPPPDHSSH